MAQLRSCYFCGTTGTLSEYETVPAHLRTEASSRQVVLCDRCHTKLTEVVKPIVDRLEPGAPSERDAPGVGDQSSERPTRTSGPDASRPSDGRSSQAEVTFAGTSGADPADRTPDDTVVSDGSVDGADATGVDETDDATDGTRVDETDDADGTGSEDDDAERSDDTAEGNEPEAHDGADTADVGTGRDDLDRVYYQLLRFLRNREFPIPRPEAETVAQSAYDLTASEASQVIQRAVDREVLDERGGQLHRN